MLSIDVAPVKAQVALIEELLSDLAAALENSVRAYSKALGQGPVRARWRD